MNAKWYSAPMLMTSMLNRQAAIGVPISAVKNPLMPHMVIRCMSFLSR